MIDDVFAVIADPTRRQILRVLASGETPVGSLVDELGVSQPTVSKHLKVLRTAGLVLTRAQGQKRLYSLTPEPLSKVTLWIDTLNKMAGRAVPAHAPVPLAPAAHASSPVASNQTTYLDSKTSDPEVKSESQHKAETQPAVDSQGEQVMWQTAPVATNVPSLLAQPAQGDEDQLQTQADPQNHQSAAAAQISVDEIAEAKQSKEPAASIPSPVQTVAVDEHPREAKTSQPTTDAQIATASQPTETTDLTAAGTAVSEEVDTFTGESETAAPETTEVASSGAVHFSPLTPFTPVPVAEPGVREIAPASEAASIPALGDIALEVLPEEPANAESVNEPAQLGGTDQETWQDSGDQQPITDTDGGSESDTAPDETEAEQAEQITVEDEEPHYEYVEQSEDSRGLLGAISRFRRKRSR